MSGSAYKKTNSTTVRQTAQVVVNADFPDGYNWRDAWRDHDKFVDGTRRYTDDLSVFVGMLTGLDYGDELGTEDEVREYYTVENMRDLGSDFGVLSWTEPDDVGNEVEREYRLTQDDLNELAELELERHWYSEPVRDEEEGGGDA